MSQTPNRSWIVDHFCEVFRLDFGMSQTPNRSWIVGPTVLCGLGVAIFLVGAVIGYFKRQQPDARFARAAEETGAIVLAVAARGEEELRLLGQLIAAQGGRGLRVE